MRNHSQNQSEGEKPSDASVEADLLFESVYDELKNLARLRVSSEGPNATLGATSLVHEVFMRLASDVERMRRFRNRAHLFATASGVMRWILVDRARARMQLKRGGSRMRVDLSESHVTSEFTDELLLSLNEALEKLEALDSESAEVVKMRFFSGFTIQEIAEATDVSYRTVSRRWGFAKAWLKEELKHDHFPE